MTKRGVVIPIIETGIIDNPSIKVIEFSSFIRQNTKLLSLYNYINVFKAYNKITNQTTKIIGIVDTNITEIGGLMSNFGNFIPYLKSSNDNDNDNDIPKLDFKYYLDLDEKLHNNNNTTFIKNDFEIYSSNDDKIKTSIFNLKSILGNQIYQDQYIKDNIESIIKNKTLTRNQKINDILDIFVNIPLIKQEIILDSDSTILLKTIANEMINDNIENLVLNNIITSENFNKNDVKIRSSESILLNIDDIRRWIKNFKSDE